MLVLFLGRLFFHRYAYGMPDISVIIPVWHETARISQTITHVRAIAAQSFHDVEIIVVDGALENDTCNAIVDPTVIKVTSAQGRARQMNAGAHIATGKFLIFLHADTRLPDYAFALLTHALFHHNAGAFSLAITEARGILQIVEWGANWRNRLTKTPYGDQALFFRAQYFKNLQGYAEIPIMEDVEIMRRIRQDNVPIVIIPFPATTSARRWRDEGILRCSLRNIFLRALYAAGVSPYTLQRWYKAFQE